MQQGISEPVFFLLNLVYKSKRIFGKHFSPDQFNKIIKHNKREGYSMNIMQQFAGLVISTITVYSYGFLLMHDGVSGLRLTKTFIGGSVLDVCLWLGPPWINWGFFFSFDCLRVESSFHCFVTER